MKQQQLLTEQQPPQPAQKHENAVSTWMHRTTVAIFWIAFGSFLATSIPHVAWLYQSFEPQDGWWYGITSYGVAVGIDVMIGWLSFVQTMGRGREVWFTWVFIGLLAACRREQSNGHASRSDNARVLHDMNRSDSKEPTHRQNMAGYAVRFELGGYGCSCATPRIRYESA